MAGEVVKRQFTATVSDLLARATTTWAEHRRLYAQGEKAWRITPAQRAADWAVDCGWCGQPHTAHPADPSTAEWAAALLADQALLVEQVRALPRSVHLGLTGGRR